MKTSTIISLTVLLLLTNFAEGQLSRRALFIGNSYTYVNNLPQLTATVALSAGDTLHFDSNAIGGYTLQLHSNNATTFAKIAVGNWDDVVLQEQSQLPSFPDAQVQTDVYPYAHILDSIINAQNPCAETMFYMTWGRKNGDSSNCASWPPVCTYDGMDSMLHLRYMAMAQMNNALVSPVGAVWKYIRQNFPSIELYQADQSHPTLSGSYAAACCFYAAIFRKSPLLITTDAGLPATDAAKIRTAANMVAFDSLLHWQIGLFDPVANFAAYAGPTDSVAFMNASQYATTYNWNFGDGC